MITQKDIHNQIVKSDAKDKIHFAEQLDFDVDKIKEVESRMTDIANSVIEMIKGAWDYLDEEIK